jgi:RNA polymerase sigma factor (sigma-70 family)
MTSRDIIENEEEGGDMASSTRSAALRQLGQLFETGTATGLDDRHLLERFVDRRDEVAFAAIIERHGPMVLGVCRAVLGNTAEVEDAFQATFLVLMRRAATIRGRDAIGGWLHRVAYRIAIQAAAEASKRRTLERRAGELAATRQGIADVPDELRAILHEEVDRLPERLRMPVVLCDLEGLERSDAARQLGWTEGALRGRLARARAKLRDRLARRGIGLSLALLTEALAKESTAAVPHIWVNELVKAAAMPAGKVVATGAITATAAKLAQATLATLFTAQAKGVATVGVLLVALGLIGSHTIPAGRAQAGDEDATGTQQPAPKPAPAPSPKPTQPEIEDRANPFTFAGIVLDPDGKPFAGAKLTVEGTGVKDTAHPPVRAASGTDGRFRFECPATDFVLGTDWKIPFGCSVVARAEGFALGASSYSGPSYDLTLHMARDDVPVQGRIVDLAGKPVPGVSVSARGIWANATGDLTAWLESLAAPNSETKPGPALDRKLTPWLILQADRPLFPPTVTDRDGRFRISGIGRERYAELWIEEPSIVTTAIHARTRPGPVIGDPDHPTDQYGRPKFVLYGAEFTYKASPSRPIEGTVFDRETGQPLPGITIRPDRPTITTTDRVSAITNAEGRYHLTGLPINQPIILPINQPIMLMATAPCDQPFNLFGMKRHELPDESLPYMRSTTPFPRADPKSNDPIRLDFKLQRGVWISGRVFDKRDGRPVPQTRVTYVADRDNPTLIKVGIDTFQGFDYGQDAAADGSFRLAVFPGPGLIAAKTARSADYAWGVGTESISRLVEGKKRHRFGYPAAPIPFRPDSYNVVAAVDPAPTDRAVKIDLPLDTGRVLRLETIDADGNLEELDAVSGRDDQPHWEPVQGPPRSDVSIMKLIAGKTRVVTARNANKALIGQVELNGEIERPVRLTLIPWGEIHGRLVLVGNQTRPEDVQIFSSGGLKTPAPWVVRIQKDGRFRIEGLVPGRSYSFLALGRQGKSIGEILHDVSVKPGEAKDVGEVTPKSWRSN